MIDEKKHIYWTVDDVADLKYFKCKRCGHTIGVEDMWLDRFKCTFCGYAIRYKEIEERVKMIEKEVRFEGQDEVEDSEVS